MSRRPMRRRAKRLEQKYILVTGLKGNATEEYVRTYFTGLKVVEVFFHVNKRNCRSGKAVVKFAGALHTAAALKFKSRRLRLQLIHKVPWLKYTGQDKDVGEQVNSTTDKVSHVLDTNSEGTCSVPPPFCPCYVRVLNLPYCTTKEDLKNVILQRETEDSQIALFTSEENRNTKEAFIVLENKTELRQCLRKNQTIFLGRTIYIFPSSEETVRQLIKTPDDEQFLQHMQSLIDRCKLRCMYVRNLPAAVSKSDIQNIFDRFNVNQEDIFVLYDENGSGMGEALVKFSTEHVAMLAERLHQQTFLGAGILLLRISEEQMKLFDGLLQKRK